MMLDVLVSIVVVGLFSYGLARFLTGTDDLLGGVMDRLRDWAYEVEVDAEGALVPWTYRVVGGTKYLMDDSAPGFIAADAPLWVRVATQLRGKAVDLVTCPYCLGFHLNWGLLWVFYDIGFWTLDLWVMAFAARAVHSLVLRGSGDK
jgi:hypothetical protein